MSRPWPFADPEDTVVITLDRILRGASPLLLVTHDRDDGAWQFLDGEHVFEEDGVAVSLAEMVAFDPGLESLADLPAGWRAWRDRPGEPWRRAEGDLGDDPGPEAGSAGPEAEESTDPADSPDPMASRNIEIKATVPDYDAMRAAIESLEDVEGPAEVLDQEDIFYEVPGARLKLRIFHEGAGELIRYERSDVAGPKASCYEIAPTSAPATMKSILGRVLPVRGVVRKERRLYRIGPTRIHLDRVEGLGDFLELEVVLRPDQPDLEGALVAEELLTRLGIDESQLISTAYIDLIVEGGEADGG
ncbi:CYTH domain protein [Aquisphaera giovannonii]|uniref:CYTH domain protein n=1 Tax=Aquisphaera giovannonii TaxID=406548 RepID=A0A5B9W6D4_9BACT|nr:class IV adenylate cyclase [Aquisphaera giovannonii]QEH35719.1 CYTH domain protein [Aquisphaera giovannonii]